LGQEALLERFYAHSLDSQVRTEYMTQGQISGETERARSLKKHVLERLTIFLAEARRKQSEYTVEWLGKEGNFKVAEVRQLSAIYSLLDGRKSHMHEEVSLADVDGGAKTARVSRSVAHATAEKSRRGGGITLTVSTTAQPDDYE
jgi:hypothetical protein